MKILVIDPVSSGRDLVEVLGRAEGTDLHVYSQQAPVEFTAPGQHSDPDPELVDLLSGERFDRVLAGSERSVTAADWAASLVGVPGNVPELIWHRRNKRGMVERAERAGLAAPRTWLFRDEGELSEQDWATAGLADGFVVKPAGSGGSDGCFICPGPDDVADVARRVLGARNLLGIANQEVLVQERVVGDQYFVNVVSVDGSHLVTEVFRYGMDESGETPHIYSAWTIATDDPLYASSVAYVLRLLEALGVRDGASHTELRRSGDRWVLIEYNGRCMGPTVPTAVYRKDRGFSQVTVLADSVRYGFQAAEAAVADGRPDACVGWHMPAPRQDGELAGLDWGPAERLPTFAGVYDEPRLGQVFRTDGRVTTASGGLLFFSDPDGALVDEDLRRSRLVELAGGYYRLGALPGAREVSRAGALS
ncbi:ATP-grasp domain-containing protein [Antribacter gilvus]|uniref:ATP-grasp domain-containing protein n=1 Tax=Antribacter gilvus TaxID=2304675 RepID=UPI000F78D4CD|nr:ATP-grasp domain-containing protein [Antribacter gilvus]